ncbi:MAG: hypothetical protein AB7P21_01645 [Lautropia sp.]
MGRDRNDAVRDGVARAGVLSIAAALLGAMAIASQDAQARSSLSATTAAGAQQASASLGVNVQVPAMLYFRLGSAGADVNTVRFDVRLAAPLNTLPVDDVAYRGALPPALRAPARADDDGASNGNVSVRVWTNNGSVSLDCAGAPLSAGAATIPLSAIQVSSSNATLAHPGASLACAARTVGAAGTNDLRANWRFRYSPTTLPPAGNYTTTVTYTASQP